MNGFKVLLEFPISLYGTLSGVILLGLMGAGYSLVAGNSCPSGLNPPTYELRIISRKSHKIRDTLHLADPIAYWIMGDKKARRGIITDLAADSIEIDFQPFSLDQVVALSPGQFQKGKKVGHYIGGGALVFVGIPLGLLSGVFASGIITEEFDTPLVWLLGLPVVILFLFLGSRVFRKSEKYRKKDFAFVSWKRPNLPHN